MSAQLIIYILPHTVNNLCIIPCSLFTYAMHFVKKTLYINVSDTKCPIQTLSPLIFYLSRSRDSPPEADPPSAENSLSLFRRTGIRTQTTCSQSTRATITPFSDKFEWDKKQLLPHDVSHETKI